MSVFRRRTRELMRRLATIASLLILVAAPLESIIPDVHDRDITQAHTHAQGAHEESQNAQAPVSDDDRTDTHRFHLDHCVHPHSTAIPAQNAAVDESVDDSTTVVGQLRSLHESVVSSPHQRPPIA